MDGLPAAEPDELQGAPEDLRVRLVVADPGGHDDVLEMMRQVQIMEKFGESPHPVADHGAAQAGPGELIEGGAHIGEHVPRLHREEELA